MAPWLRGVPSSSEIYEYMKKGTSPSQNVITFLTSRSSINFHDGLFFLQYYFFLRRFGAKNLGSHCIPLGYGQHLGPAEHDQLEISPSEVTLPLSGSKLTKDLPDPIFTAYLNATGCPAFSRIYV